MLTEFVILFKCRCNGVEIFYHIAQLDYKPVTEDARAILLARQAPRSSHNDTQSQL